MIKNRHFKNYKRRLGRDIMVQSAKVTTSIPIGYSVRISTKNMTAFLLHLFL